MQLVAYGAQDIYLTGNPQITFFKVVYRRYTNFSMESIQQTWNGFNNGQNGRCTATISRNGDLVHKMYIQIDRGTVNASWQGCNPGANWINTISVEIGGQTIDKQYGSWLETWAELTEPNVIGARALVNLNASSTTAAAPPSANPITLTTRFQRMSGYGGVAQRQDKDTDAVGFNMAAGRHFYVPLQFWFNRNVGLSLPLIALQYHEVNIVLEHKFKSVWNTYTASGAATQSLWADYIYLDTDERRRFAQVSHEYLIEQLQMQTSTGNTIDLNFNHPVKELIWTGEWNTTAPTASVATGFNKTLTYGGTNDGQGGSSGNTTYQIKLNGQDRFAARPLTYFTKLQVQQYHTGPGGLNVENGGVSTVGYLSAASSSYSNAQAFNDSIAVYSFALNPEEHQPSGTCNFSRIDTAQLVRSGTTPPTGSNTYNVYAVNYNVLRIMSGMGGLAYSN